MYLYYVLYSSMCGFVRQIGDGGLLGWFGWMHLAAPQSSIILANRRYDQMN